MTIFNRSVRGLTLGLCLFSVSIIAEETEECCIKDPAPEHLSVSHTEGKGLGYSRGFSSLELFLSQPFLNKTLVPFIDLRGHIFNHGKYAANAGLGLRYLSDCYKQIWGINAFYDYLQHSRKNYQQVGVGLEVLGENWDARVNGYIIVGTKNTNIYRFGYESFGSVLIEGDPDLGLDAIKLPGFRLKAREQLAFSGIDSLFGYRYCKIRNVVFHIGAGPYYYRGTTAKTKNAFRSIHQQAIGGQLRAEFSFMDYIFLKGIACYDSFFKWSGQGVLTLSIPFDFTYKFKKHCRESKRTESSYSPKKRWGKSKSAENCVEKPKCTESSYCLKERLFRPIERNEIIVVQSINRTSTNPQVFDPEFEP